jgi:hypothetical protein
MWAISGDAHRVAPQNQVDGFLKDEITARDNFTHHIGASESIHTDFEVELSLQASTPRATPRTADHRER